MTIKVALDVHLEMRDIKNRRSKTGKHGDKTNAKTNLSITLRTS